MPSIKNLFIFLMRRKFIFSTFDTMSYFFLLLLQRIFLKVNKKEKKTLATKTPSGLNRAYE